MIQSKFFYGIANMKNLKLVAILCMLMSMISSQFSASIAKSMIQDLDALTVTIFRLFFAAIISFLLFKSWRIFPRLKFIKWKDLLLYSLSLCAMNTLFYFSLGKLPLGIAVGLEFTGPLLLALFSTQQRSDYIWVGLAILGVLFMVPWQEAIQLNFSFLGAFCALAAGFCWAFYIYFGQRVATTGGLGMHGLSLALCFSSFILLPIGFAYNPIALVTPQYWVHGIIIAIFAAALPYTLDILALKQLSRLSYGTLSSLSPVFAALAGLIVLHEYLSILQWIALILIMLASIGVTLRKENKIEQQEIIENK